MKMKNSKCYMAGLYISKVIVILTSFFYAEASMAFVCTFKSGWNPNNNKYISMPDTLNIDNSTPVGSVVYSADYVITSSEIQISDCPGPGQWTYFIRNGNHLSIKDVSETNISGLSWKVYSRVRHTTEGYAPVLGSMLPTPSGGWLNAGDYIRIELIKTKAHVESGILSPTLYATFGQHHDSEYYVGLYVRSNSSTKVVGKSCEILGDKNKAIDFKNVINKNLSSISGIVPDTQKEVVIDLRCNPGSKVSVTFDSQYKDSYLQSSLVNQGDAKGIYVYFPGIDKLGQSNTVINSSGEIETIRQTVELYRKGEFTSGSISTQATYTLNYE